MKLKCSGESSLTGFTVNLFKPKKLRLQYITGGSTSNYDYGYSYRMFLEMTNLKRWNMAALLTGVVMWIAIMFFHQIHFLLAILWGFIAVRCIIVSIQNIGIVYKFPEVLSQWHGCEHKLLGLYIKDIPRNKANLKKSRRQRWHCGTKAVTSTLIFGIILFVSIFIPMHPVLLIAWLFAGLYLAPLFSILFQTYLNTAEPTEEQLCEALVLATKLDAHLLEEEKQAS